MGVAEAKLWLSNKLSDDLAFISRYHSVSDRELMMNLLVGSVKTEKARIQALLEKEYVTGFIDDTKFSELAGHVPSPMLKCRREMIASESADS